MTTSKNKRAPRVTIVPAAPDAYCIVNLLSGEKTAVIAWSIAERPDPHPWPITIRGVDIPSWESGHVLRGPGGIDCCFYAYPRAQSGDHYTIIRYASRDEAYAAFRAYAEKESAR